MNFESKFSAPFARTCRLGELLDFRNDIVHPKDKPSGASIFVGLEHIERDTGVRIGAERIDLSELTGRRARFCAGDIVYGYLRPYLNKVWIAEFDGICSVDQYVFMVRPEVDRDFIAQFLRSAEFLKTAPIDSTPGQLPRIRSGEIAATPISLPPLAEQRRIAAILDKADALRRKRLRALDLLDCVVQSIFIEMFDAPTIRSASLGELCTKVTDGTHQSPEWSKEGVPFLFVSNIRKQRISFDTKNFVSDSEYEKLTKHSPIEPGDVLYTAVGSYGNAAVVSSYKKFVFQRHIAHLKLRRDQVNPRFLSIALEMPSARAQADKYARGVAQKTVTLASLKEMRVPFPPIESQNAFSAKIDAVYKLAQSNEEYVRVSKAFFYSLQEQAFSARP